jgi:IMP dehydrogenase/GMP reductase
MIKDTNTRSICFDDVLLVPKKSSIPSRSSVSIESEIGNPNQPKSVLKLRSPFFMAPMEFISSPLMISKLVKFGGIGFIPRLTPLDDRMLRLKKTIEVSEGPANIGFCISSYEVDNVNLIDNLNKSGVKILLVDTALGHLDLVTESIKKLRKNVSEDTHIMCGNISSYEAYESLMNAGADSVRVGIGGGAACLTRIVTGFGVPTLSSIMDIYDKVKGDKINGIVADGGIKNNGDAVKAFAAGASGIMMGSFFAGHDECDRGVNGDHIFRGLASRETQLNQNPDAINNLKALHVEGASGSVHHKGSIDHSIQMLINNICSGLSYCGSPDLKHFRENSTYIEVSSQSTVESNKRI